MQDLIQSRNLTKQEKKNVFLATACGCLGEIHDKTPGPWHLKKKRMLRVARQAILDDIGPMLPRVTDNNMELFIDTIKASDKVLKELMKNNEEKRDHVLLNLASFCLNELPLRDKHWNKFNPLFDLFEGVHEYQDIKSGERVFHRIESEVQILVAQRGGILL